MTPPTTLVVETVSAADQAAAVVEAAIAAQTATASTAMDHEERSDPQPRPMAMGEHGAFTA